jgi:CdiI immunity protein
MIVTPRRRIATIRRAQVPALANFARAYLHEDFEAEYGSPEGAAAAFSADASETERADLARDIAHLTTNAGRWSVAALQRFMTREIGGAWRPESVDAVKALEQALKAGSRLE